MTFVILTNINMICINSYFLLLFGASGILRSAWFLSVFDQRYPGANGVGPMNVYFRTLPHGIITTFFNVATIEEDTVDHAKPIRI